MRICRFSAMTPTIFLYPYCTLMGGDPPTPIRPLDFAHIFTIQPLIIAVIANQRHSIKALSESEGRLETFIHSFVYSPNAIKTKHNKITQLGMTTRQRICTYRSRKIIIKCVLRCWQAGRAGTHSESESVY